MKPNADEHDSLARHLRTGLRDTTPEFEARFDALRRRLAQAGPRRARFGLGRAWIGAGVGAAVAAAIVVFVMRPGSSPDFDSAAFGELVAMDEVLRQALVLANDDTREAVLFLPADAEVGS